MSSAPDRPRPVTASGEGLHRRLLEALPDAVLVDAGGRIAYCNVALAALLGASTCEELLGRPSLSLFLPARHGALRERVDAAPGAPAIEEVVREDGELVAVEVVCTRVDLAAEPSVLVVLRALGPERQVERRLRASIEGVKDHAIYTVDVFGAITTWNDGAARVFGYEAGEVVGRLRAVLFTPEDQAALAPASARERAAEHGDATGERWRLRKGGARFWAHEALSAARDADGRLLGFVEVVQDLTERRRAEEALQASESRYRTLFERAPLGIVYADAESRYVDANECIARMLGYARQEVIGLHASDIVSPAEVARIRPALGEIHDGGEHRRRWLFRRKDGSTFLGDVVATRFDDGTLLGMIRDVTALEAHEREVERMSRLYAALSEVNKAIVRVQTGDELFLAVCRALVEHGGLRMAWIGWNDADHRLVPVARWGDEDGYLGSVEVHSDDRPTGQGPSGRAFRAGRPYITNDLHGDPATTPWRSEALRRGFMACAALPIREAGQVRGTLNVYADSQGFFRAEEVGLLEEAAADLSFALDGLARDEARRVAEEAARSEMLFSSAMIESMPGILYFYDHEGRFLRWNRNFEAVSGYSGDEVARMHPRAFFRLEDRARVEARIAEVFERGESSLEAPFLSRDGRVTPYYFTGRRIDLQGRPCLVGVGIDISERERAKARLLESEAHLLAAQRIAGIGSWELDLRTGALRWSDPVRELFGVGQGEFGGTFEAFLALVHPEDRARLQAAQQATLAGQGRLDMEHRVILRDGRERVVHDRAELKRDAAGRAVALAGTVHDITDRARMEAERERRRRAEAADRIKSAFLATMSHELRTPLNSIIGFTGIMLQRLAGPLTAEQQKQLDMVRTSARHLLALVNDVLDISKIEAGQLEVAREPFDPRRSIEKVLALIAPQAAAKGLALRPRLAQGLREVVSDARRFEQVLLNLLSNAVKFTDQGEVTLVAEPVDDYRAPGEDAGQPAIRLRVTDTGVGIAPEDLPALFQPFQQVDSGLARLHEGTGLGLAICRRLTALMGGEVHAESERGKGSSFIVTLPLRGPVKP